jgi:uncharacterized protein (DUF4415 family)
MRSEYDLSKLKGLRNPYAKALKKQVTIRLGTDVILYFKSLAEEMGVPYQSLINLYLRDCKESHRKLTWTAKSRAGQLRAA